MMILFLQFFVALVIIMVITSTVDGEKTLQRRLRNANQRSQEIVTKTQTSSINSIFIMSKIQKKDKKTILDAPDIISGIISNFLNEQTTNLKEALYRAGMRDQKSLSGYIKVIIIFGILLSIIAIGEISKYFANFESLKIILMFLIFLPVGLYCSNFIVLNYIRSIARSRQELIDEGIPDLLDLMVICAEAGFDIQKIFTRTAEEIALSNKVLSDELQRTNAEFKLSLDFQKNLKNLEERTQSVKMRSLINIIIQSIEMGSSLTEGLRTLSSEIRTERALKAEEMAGKIPNKITLPLLLFLMPCLFIIILGPLVLKASNIFDI